MKRNVQLGVSLLSLLALLLISTGVSYSLVDQTQTGDSDGSSLQGEKEEYNDNEIKFLYTDYDGNGSQLSLTGERLLSDEIGKYLPPLENTEIFDFKIKAEKGEAIPYQITLTKEDGSTLSDDLVKVYLTEVNGTEEHAIAPTLQEDGTVTRFSQLENSTIQEGNTVDKILYVGSTSGDEYEKNFRLRVWVAEDAPITVAEDGTIHSTIQNEQFNVRVNVYTLL